MITEGTIGVGVELVDKETGAAVMLNPTRISFTAYQATNLHGCTQCDCAVFTSDKKLAHHHHTKHHDSQKITNLALCFKLIQGELPPNHNPIWDKGLQFIHHNIAPNPASF